MNEQKRLTDHDFSWTSSVKTDVQATWKRFGWKATTEEEREARQRRASNDERKVA